MTFYWQPSSDSKHSVLLGEKPRGHRLATNDSHTPHIYIAHTAPQFLLWTFEGFIGTDRSNGGPMELPPDPVIILLPSLSPVRHLYVLKHPQTYTTCTVNYWAQSSTIFKWLYLPNSWSKFASMQGIVCIMGLASSPYYFSTFQLTMQLKMTEKGKKGKRDFFTEKGMIYQKWISG